MDHGSGSSSGGVSGDVMMRPFFHFDGGDYLLFQAWHPQSGGAIAGACVGLFMFALLERWIHAISSMLESQWQQKALQATKPTQYDRVRASSSSTDGGSEVSSKKQKPAPLRTIPPFMFKLDIPRGILYAFQRLMGYTLMLAAMTFHAGYIISIIAGLVLGEILFGRIPQGATKAGN